MFDVVIIGGGILGTALSYFISSLKAADSVAVIEQAPRVAFHTSGRNTGKVHAPYLYNPKKKKIFAKTAFLGYNMWSEYCAKRGMPFKKDGVIEVATGQDDAETLAKYMKWGVENGLKEEEIKIVSGSQLLRTEPNVRCESALVVSREGSVDYARLTRCVMDDSAAAGTVFLLGARAANIVKTQDGWSIQTQHRQPHESGAAPHRGIIRRQGAKNTKGVPDNNGSTCNDTIQCRFLINAAGGESMDIAHDLGLATDLADVHFRGEYWKAPLEYSTLTKMSIYSVPKFPEYPFLDPHWIVRSDGRCEIGPNAVPVFSPYGYDHAENARSFLPKVLELAGSGAIKTVFDTEFQSLVIGEIHSSLSKSAMIDRVKKFLPSIDPDRIKERGTAGIRSSVIGPDGKFVPDVILKDDSESSFHILNYNSPGATGVLPFSAHVTDTLQRAGFLGASKSDVRFGLWKFSEIIERIYEK